MKERYQKHIFFTSAIIAIVLFSSGFLLAWTLDHYRVTDVVDMLKKNELDAESYLVEREFIDTLGGETCDLLEPRFEKLSIDLGEIGHSLTEYETSKVFKEADYEYLKRRYFVLEIRTYLLLLKLKERCNSNKVSILYFYKQNDDTSIRQGYVLDSLVEKYKEKLLVYSFDKDFKDTPIVDMVETHYGIIEAPTVIVNGEIKKEGFTSKDELKRIIESELNE